jgi:hypothetical protein
MASPFLTSRDTGADEQKPFGLELFAAAVGIGIVGVATIDDDIALVEVGDELSNEVVDSGTSLDEKDDFSWSLELLTKLLDRVGTLNLGS